MAVKKSYVSKKLTDASKTYEQRNAMYKDAYKNHGYAMAGFFPDGVQLNTPEDFNRFGLFSAVVGKLNRYARQFEDGGHEDSLDDASVYAQMLNEIDHEIQG